MLAVDNLVALHRAGRTVWQEVDRDMQIREKNDVKRRNREMKRVHNYIAKQSPKREFESLFMQAFPYFYEQGLNCEQAEAGTAGKSEHMGYCHGTYNHHSVLVCGTADARYIATINFENIISGTSCRICIISFGKPWKKWICVCTAHCDLRTVPAGNPIATDGRCVYLWTLPVS